METICMKCPIQISRLLYYWPPNNTFSFTKTFFPYLLQQIASEAFSYNSFLIMHLGKIFSRRHFYFILFFFLFFTGYRIWYLMPIVFNGDNLHEMSNPDLWETKKNIINLSSAKHSQRVVKVKETVLLLQIDRLLNKKKIICPFFLKHI